MSVPDSEFGVQDAVAAKEMARKGTHFKPEPAPSEWGLRFEEGVFGPVSITEGAVRFRNGA